MSELVLIPLTTLIAQALVMGYVLSFRQRDKVFHSFFFYLTALAIWMIAALFNFLKLSPEFSIINSKISSLGWLSFGALYLLFIYRFLERRISFFVYFFFGLAAAAIAITLTTDLVLSGMYEYNWGYESGKGPLFLPIVFTVLIIPVLYSIGRIILSLRTSDYPIQRNQLILMLAGTLISGTIAFLSDIAFPYIFKLEEVQIGAASTLIQTVFTVYALTKYREVTIELLDSSRVLFDNMNDGVVLIDKAGIITQVNTAAEEILEQKSSTLRRKKLNHFLPDYSKKDTLHNIAVTTSNNRIVEMTVSPVFSHNMPIGKIVILKDVREKKHIERVLIESLDEALEANKAKDEFMWNISHELRTPLHVILGLNEHILETETDEEKREILRRTLLAGKSLKEMIDNLLTLTRLENRDLLMEAKKGNVHIMMNSIAREFERKAQKKNLIFEYYLDPSVPESMETDFSRLSHVIRSILSNSIKFTEHGKISFTISTQQDRTTRSLKVSVSDTGMGIPTEKLNLILESFGTVDNSTTKEKSGLGLGLYIVRRLVQLLHGKLKVESQEKQGTTIEIILPLDYGESDFPGVSDKTLPVPRSRLLLVDDSEDNRMLIHTFLKTFDLEITEAQNGKEAIDKFLEAPEPFSLILMDIQMPLVDGFTATETIRSFEQERAVEETPIIALTAYSMESDRRKALEAGCNEYLIKPIRKKDLLEKLGNYLGVIKN